MPAKLPSLYLKEAERQIGVGDLAGAADSYSALLKAHPKYMHRGRIRHRLGTVYSRLGEWDQAITTLTKATRERPGNADVFYHLAQAQIYAERREDAIRSLESALGIDPDHADSLARMAAMTQFTEGADEAIAQVEAIERRGIRSASLVLTFASLAPKLGRTDEAIRRLGAMVDEPGVDDSDRAGLLFNMAYLLDREERYDEAWEAAERGNRSLDARHDPGQFDREVDRIIETATPEQLRAMPEPVDRAADAVLIVGSPRSGTTLIEQIIEAHPRSDTAGEMDSLPRAVRVLRRAAGPTLDIARIRRPDVIKASGLYLTNLRERASRVKGAARRVDKQPHNWEHLGIASRLLPEASVIYCERDPRDIAISTFFRNFVAGHQYSTRLDWIGRYLRGSRRVMRHWMDVIPRVTDSFKITTARYEQVVTNPEEETRRLIDHIGLEWDEACLRFSERRRVVVTLSADQVGRGVYTDSLQRWRRYEKYMGPLMEALGDEAPSD